MTEYIEREKALESVREKLLITDALPDGIPKDASTFTLASMQHSLESIPAADVVPMSWVREHMSGDYISREQAVENAIDQMRHSASETAMRERLLNLVAADVRPVVKSHWVDNHVAFYRGCPECGAFVRANLDEVFLRDLPSAVGRLNFCPNCGADMREES